MDPLRFFTGRAFIVVVGVLLLLVGGIASYRNMPVDLLPGVSFPLINVVTHYPAGTARDLELLVTRPIENALQGLQQLQRVTSVSAPGFSQVTVQFEPQVGVLAARQLVVSALAQAAPVLPAGAQPVLENLGSSLDLVSTYTLSGGADAVTLRGWADYALAPALQSEPGVARVQVMGGGVQALRVDLDPRALLDHGLSIEDVRSAIARANVLESGGFIEAHGRDLLVSTRAQIHTVEDLQGVQVGRGADGRPLLLGDVAHVYAGALPERYRITSSRRPAVAFLIQKQPSASTLAVSRAVDARLAELRPPDGARIRKFYDQAEIIALAYRNMRNELLAGATLSVLALFFVLGRNRSTLIVAVTMPLTVIATFIVMRWTGFGINLMTLGAVTVTIGMINDDTVLVLENIVRHRQLGEAPFAAVRKGVREIFGADVSGTLVVVASFAPLVLLGGLAGLLFRPFGVTFALVLTLSLGFSLTLIPWAAARWPPEPGRTERTLGSRGIEWLGRWNAHLLDALLAHRASTLTVAVLLMVGSLGLLAFNRVSFLPLLDENSLLISYQLAPGTSLAESDRVGDAIEAMALAEPGVTAVFRRTGSPGGTFFLEGPDAGELVLRIAPGAKPGAAARIRRDLNRSLEDVPGVLTRISEPTSEKIGESLSGLPALFGITVFGNNLEQLHAAADAIEQAAAGTPGVSSVINNTKVPVDTLEVVADRRALARYGVTPQALARAVQDAVQGVDASRSVVNGRVLHLFVRYARSARARAADLAAIRVRAASGALVSLGELARVQRRESIPSIEHQFGTRALTLIAGLSGDPFAVMARLDRVIAALHLPAGVRVAYTGQYRELLRTGLEILVILALSALLVYGIMALQLGGLLDPAVILVKLPIDFMGAALALFLARQPLDLTVTIGFVTLVGVAVNNGIVLLTFARELRAQGLGAVPAIHEAVRVRLRPLVLTHLTSILALLPAALGLGRGPQLLQPLGIMLLGGLTVGTVLTLNLIPVIYVATERWRHATPAAPSTPLSG